MLKSRSAIFVYLSLVSCLSAQESIPELGAGDTCIVRPSQVLDSANLILGSVVSSSANWVVSVAQDFEAQTDKFPVVIYRLKSDLESPYAESWTEAQRLYPFRNDLNSIYAAVLITEQFLFVSDIWDICDSVMSGAVYVYRRDDAGTPNEAGDDIWRAEARICALNPKARDNFGVSLAFDGNTLAIGAPFDPVLPSQFTERGAAYLFERISSDTSATWVQKQKLIPNDTTSNGRFGGSVSISGDKLVVGAELQRNGTYLDSSGAAYIYRRGVSSWVQTTKVTPSANHIQHFGQEVLVLGNYLMLSVIGTWDVYSAGEVRVYKYLNSNWALSSILQATDRSTDARFGSSLGFDGRWAVIGASGRASIPNSGDSEGALYLYELQAADVWAERAIYQGQRLDSNAQLGVSAALSADYAFGATVLEGVRVFRLHDWVCFAADFDQDQDVDLVDVSNFTNCFSADTAQPADECLVFDLNRDQIIDLVDYAQICRLMTAQ